MKRILGLASLHVKVVENTDPYIMAVVYQKQHSFLNKIVWQKILDKISQVLYYITKRKAGSRVLRLSTKGRYGVKAIYELAKNYGHGPTTVKTISVEQGIPLAFLEQVFNALKNEGLIHSVRGRDGGYILSREPELITVGDVIRILEGPIALCDCLIDEAEGRMPSEIEGCVTFILWKRIGKILENSFDTITFQKLLEDMDKPSQAVLCPTSHKGRKKT